MANTNTSALFTFYFLLFTFCFRVLPTFPPRARAAMFGVRDLPERAVAVTAPFRRPGIQPERPRQKQRRYRPFARARQMCWFHGRASCNCDACRFPCITPAFELCRLEIPHLCEIFRAVNHCRREIRRISRGVGIAHHAIGWCVMRLRFASVGAGLSILAAACAPMPTVALEAI